MKFNHQMNVEMPTIQHIIYPANNIKMSAAVIIIIRISFMLSWVECEKKFITLGHHGLIKIIGWDKP